MQRAAEKPQHTPNVIPVFQVADFMRQNVLYILRRSNKRQNNVGLEYSHQAGSGNRIREIYRNGSNLPFSAQLLICLYLIPAPWRRVFLTLVLCIRQDDRLCRA